MGSCLVVKQLGHDDDDQSPPSGAEILLLALDDFVAWKGTILSGLDKSSVTYVTTWMKINK